MDPEITALASTAGTALVTLLATDGWERVKGALVSLWRRTQPERAEDMASALDATHEDLLTARRNGDADTADELGVEWQGRIRRLIAAHPQAAADLRALLAEFPVTPAVPTVTQHATASGNARVYQAGRDQHLGQR